MKRRSIQELRMRAREELAINETITKYEVLDDGFVIAGPANPYAGLRASMNRLSASALRMNEALAGLGDVFQARPSVQR